MDFVDVREMMWERTVVRTPPPGGGAAAIDSTSASDSEVDSSSRRDFRSADVSFSSSVCGWMAFSASGDMADAMFVWTPA